MTDAIRRWLDKLRNLPPKIRKRIEHSDPETASLLVSLVTELAGYFESPNPAEAVAILGKFVVLFGKIKEFSDEERNPKPRKDGKARNKRPQKKAESTSKSCAPSN